MSLWPEWLESMRQRERSDTGVTDGRCQVRWAHRRSAPRDKCSRETDCRCVHWTQEQRQDAVELLSKLQTENELHDHVVLQALGYWDLLYANDKYEVQMPLTVITLFFIAAKNDSGGCMLLITDLIQQYMRLTADVKQQEKAKILTVKGVIAEEFKALDALGWKLNRPTALSAMNLYLEVCRLQNEEETEVAKEIEETCDRVCSRAIRNGVSCKYLPSTVAAAAIVVARRSTALKREAKDMQEWTTNMTNALGAPPRNLKDCLADLGAMVRDDKTDQVQDHAREAGRCRNVSDEPPTKQRKFPPERAHVVQVGAA